MGKLTVFTTITPLPSNVPRQLALDMLHSHTEVIELNPLVTGVKAIDAPRDASGDEYFSSWYEITEIISWGLGLKKKLSFKGVFHDQPWGLQTHVYLPLGVDLRNKYRIGGNQPDEPREVRELGVDTPLDGLYLRNDVEIICNAAMAGFIKKETKAAIGTMIDRMTRKAELLDEGKLHAMFENGRLKTSKASTTLEDNPNTVVASPPVSPAPFRTSPALTSPGLSPAVDARGYGHYHDVARQASQHRNSQLAPAGYSPQQGHQFPVQSSELPSGPVVMELPGSVSFNVSQPQQQSFAAELPGDNSYTAAAMQPPQQSLDSKPPMHYQAYTPPPPAHPIYAPPRNGFPSADQAAPPPAPPPTQHRDSQASFASARHPSVSSSTYSNSNLTTTTAATSISAARPTSSVPSEPDHSRFASLAIGGSSSSGNAASTLPSQRSTATPPPQTLHSRSPPPPPLAMQGQNAKCPVCGLFEGDEAAVSHHVSKAHFS